MIKLSVAIGVGKFGLECATKVYSRMWQGGNQWSGWVSYLSFFKHVANLDLDYSKYDHWEKAAIHGGPRVMHEEFCIVSDRPEILLVDSENRPHCETGPFCKWRDGSALYSLHGIRVPAWVVETPAAEITKEMLLSESNADVRREIIRKIGMQRTSELLQATIVDAFETPNGGKYELLHIDFDGRSNRTYLRMKCPSTDFTHILGVRPDIATAKAAWCYLNNETEYQHTVWEA